MNIASKNVQKHMDDLGWSAYRLAKEAGLPESTTRDFLKRGSSSVNLVHLEKISSAIGVEMWRLFKGD